MVPAGAAKFGRTIVGALVAAAPVTAPVPDAGAVLGVVPDPGVGAGAGAGMVPVPAGLPGAGADSTRPGTSAAHNKKAKPPTMNLGFINPFPAGNPGHSRPDAQCIFSPSPWVAVIIPRKCFPVSVDYVQVRKRQIFPSRHGNANCDSTLQIALERTPGPVGAPSRREISLHFGLEIEISSCDGPLLLCAASFSAGPVPRCETCIARGEIWARAARPSP
jgi:hypothetical protein